MVHWEASLYLHISSLGLHCYDLRTHKSGILSFLFCSSFLQHSSGPTRHSLLDRASVRFLVLKDLMPQFLRSWLSWQDVLGRAAIFLSIMIAYFTRHPLVALIDAQLWENGTLLLPDDDNVSHNSNDIPGTPFRDFSKLICCKLCLIKAKDLSETLLSAGADHLDYL